MIGKRSRWMEQRIDRLPVRLASLNFDGRNRTLTDILLFLAYLTAGAVKMRAYLFEGRFWAEEGPWYFAHINASKGLEGLFFIYNGHIELVANTVVLLATWVDFRYAPLVTSLLSFAVQSIPVFVIIRYRAALGLDALRCLLLIVFAVGVPQAAEVWANSISLHFHLSLLAAVIAATPISREYPRHTFRLALLVAGLSSIPATFLTPILALSFWRDRNRERLVQTAILAAATFVQLALIVSHGTGTRSVDFEPLIALLAITAQQVVAPLLGTELGSLVSAELRQVLNGDLLAIGVMVFFAAPLVALLVVVLGQRDARINVLCIAAFWMALLSIATALGGKISLISAGVEAPRYFYVPNVLLFLALLTASAKRRSLLTVAMILAGLALLRVDYYLDGPPWSGAYREAAETGAGVVAIWPNGWTVPSFIVPSSN